MLCQLDGRRLLNQVTVSLVKATAILFLLPIASLCQQPLLQITAPANGAVVAPGQNLTISVSSPAGAALSQLDVIGGNPIGSSSIATSVPAQFSLAIPSDIGAGQYFLIAEGTTTSGQDAESTPIMIDVERSDVPTQLSASLSSIIFSRIGQSVPLLVIATFSDRTTLDVTNSSHLSLVSMNPNVASVGSNGMVTALGSGNGSINANYTIAADTLSVPVPLIIPASVTGAGAGFSLAVTPFMQTAPAGDNTTYDLSLAPRPGFSGTAALSVTGLPTGATASFNPTELSSGSGPSTLTISTTTSTPRGTYSLAVVGSSGSFYPSTSMQLEVLAQNSDDFSLSTTPATQTVYLGSSSNFAINETGLNGFNSNVTLISIAGLPSGATSTFTPATITGGSGSSVLNVAAASTTPVGSYLLTITGSSSTEITNSTFATLTVSPILQSIAITPTGASIAPGKTQQFAATGTYSNGTTQALTSGVTWTSSSSATATITPSGLATGVASGTTTITATSSGITSPGVTLTVTAPVLTSIAVTPNGASIAAGTTQQFTATGTYSNGTSQALTTGVTWTSSSRATATIASTGIATGVAAGTTTITATASGITSQGVTLTVTAVTLTSIAVTPSAPLIAVGSTQQFTATGTYSNGTTQALTTGVTWTSSSTAAATIASSGIATAVALGTTTITASSSGINSPGVSLTVISVSPQSLTFPSQSVGTTSAGMIFQITNPSATAVLVLTSIVASGDFTQSNNCPASPEGIRRLWCTATVTFTPSAKGTRTGSVTITDNAVPSPQIVTLTGTGM